MTDEQDMRAALRAAAEPRLVETARELEACMERWRNCPVLGIDTEFVRERTYRADLGLIQVSDGATAWLVDPLAVDRIEMLPDLFHDPSVTKVFHSASEDLEVLWLTLGVSPEPMLDTQIACALLGEPLQLSYHNAVKSSYGIEVDKEQTRSNWLKRPLTAEQLHYAATDVVFLPMLFNLVREKLTRLNRWEWLLEDVELMRLQSKQSPSPSDAYLRIRGAGRLSQQQLRLLSELAHWREETAIAKNLARGFVIPDSALIQLAITNPASIRDVEGIDNLHPRAVQRYGEKLLQVLREAEQSKTAVTPLASLNNRQKKQLDVMRRLVRRRGEALGVDPALLASRRMLEALLHAQAAGSGIPERLKGWRKSVITDELLDSMSNP